MKKNVQRLLTISILTSMTGAGIFAIKQLCRMEISQKAARKRSHSILHGSVGLWMF